jgi:hypothetical protein
MKKLSNSIKFIIVVGAFALAFLLFTIVTASYSLGRAKNSIAAIGKVTYSEESKALIDQAVADYDALDQTVGLTTTFSTAVDKNVDYATLLNAKAEYVRLAIKTATVAEQRKVADGYTTEDLIAFVNAARKAADDYFTDDFSAVENYADLQRLEERYGVKNEDDGGSTDSSSDKTDEIELC